MLPFENLSDDKENSYFAAGVQDEVADEPRQDHGPESHQPHIGDAV